MRTLLATLLVIVLAIGPATASETRTESATYILSVEPMGFCGFPVNKGCVVFFAQPGEQRVFVEARDTLGLPVSIFACQDLGGQVGCVDEEDARAAGCGSVTLAEADGFRGGVPVVVTLSTLPAVNAFIIRNDANCTDPAPVTTGTVTATFSS